MGARHVRVRCWPFSLAVGMIACSDGPTGSASLDVRRILKPNAPSASVVYQSVGTYSIPSLSNASSPSAQGSALPGFTKKTLLRATISGNVSTALTPYNHGEEGQPTVPGAPRTFGPAGYYYGGGVPDCGAKVYVGYGSFGGGTGFSLSCAPDGSSDTISTGQGFLYAAAGGGAGSAIRSGAGGYPGSCASYVGSFSGYGPCFYFNSSGQTVTVERPEVDFSVTPSQITVNYKDTVTITSSISPSALGGLNVPWEIQSVTWAPSLGSRPRRAGPAVLPLPANLQLARARSRSAVQV